MNIFSVRLSELMKETATTQSKLAASLNVRQQTISKYVTGENEPDFDILIKIAEFFDVSTDYLLGVTDL